MYFAVSWLEPRLKINQSAEEWKEARTGPTDVREDRTKTEVFYLVDQEVNESPEILKYIWYPELEIYGLDTFGRQRVLKEMSGVRVNRNRTITYELGWVYLVIYVLLPISVITIFRVRISISCQMNFDDYPLDEHTCQFQVGSCKLT